MLGLLDKDAPGFSRLATYALIGLLGFAGWRYLHPKASFAADGTDPAWDGRVARSQADHKPGLVLFTADWCGGCRAPHEQTLSQSEVVAAVANRYTPSVVDMTSPTAAARQRADRMGVRGYPTLIRFDADGGEVARTHYLPPDAMVKWLRGGE